MLISLEQPSYTVREDLTDGKNFGLLICAVIQEEMFQNATVVLEVFTSQNNTATGKIHYIITVSDYFIPCTEIIFILHWIPSFLLQRKMTLWPLNSC